MVRVLFKGIIAHFWQKGIAGAFATVKLSLIRTILFLQSPTVRVFVRFVFLPAVYKNLYEIFRVLPSPSPHTIYFQEATQYPFVKAVAENMLNGKFYRTEGSVISINFDPYCTDTSPFCRSNETRSLGTTFLRFVSNHVEGRYFIWLCMHSVLIQNLHFIYTKLVNWIRDGR